MKLYAIELFLMGEGNYLVWSIGNGSLECAIGYQVMSTS